MACPGRDLLLITEDIDLNQWTGATLGMYGVGEWFSTLENLPSHPSAILSADSL